jgi:hypothetical protein
MDLIARETKGQSFKTFKYPLDAADKPSILYEYDDIKREIRWNELAETDSEISEIDLREKANEIIETGTPSIFTYFLDGSRRIYKVDDIGYEKKKGGRMLVLPVVAGQIGIGCLKRTDKIMSPEKYIGQNVISLPSESNPNPAIKNGFYEAKLTALNELALLSKNGIKFNAVLEYKTATPANGKDVSYEDRAVAKIQDEMINAEQKMVEELVRGNKLAPQKYLLKDGSLEYRTADKFKRGSNEEKTFINRYNYVIGASKKFNPESCHDKNNKPNPGYIANLKLYHRTPVARFKNESISYVQFAVWFVRIRDKRYSSSPFDGILKLEKMLVTEGEIENGIDSELVNFITACVINERNPVCYGNDTRWANHLYPVYLTEQYVKSKYIGKDMFLNLF